jgi:hypothetical protein
MKWQCSFSCGSIFQICLIKNSLNCRILRKLWIFFSCVLGSVDLCFQITIAFVCYRHESFAYNIFCFISVSPSFERRKCCLKITIKSTLSLWHIIGKKTQNVYLSLYIRKIQTKICWKLQNHTHLQNKTSSKQAQTQQLVDFFLSVRKCNYWVSILLQNASKHLQMQNESVGTIIIWHSSVLALLQVPGTWPCDSISDIPLVMITISRTNSRLQLLCHSM